MQSDKDIPGISCGLVDSNVLEWEVMLMISEDCKYYGGMLPSKVCSRKEHELTSVHRWLFPSLSYVPRRIPTHAT